ncbi:MAG: chorismate lyase [Gammaproteobacteria bacterium]|nr:chorismate lyase [Gammaproteobacteria bacterium]MBM4223398.1 chorismate lyase [Gammaproteobacteria bacterium]MBM4229217.1 chorismate lyase [Gammaproteobacteria bacterium]
MTDMAVSADNLGLPPPVPTAAMWLPGQALNCHVGDQSLRSWLLTPGLLTQRIREAAGDGFAMHLLREARIGDEQIREIDMSCDNEVWMFAHTRIPATTLEAEPWLGRIGTRTLGEALEGRAMLTRESFRYAQFYPDIWLVARALAHAALAPQPLWIRHSALRMGAAPFDLYEVFLPNIGQRRPR